MAASLESLQARARHRARRAHRASSRSTAASSRSRSPRTDLVAMPHAPARRPGARASRRCSTSCGVDYQGYDGAWDGPRFAVVYNLLSIAHNWRVRVRVFCAGRRFPGARFGDRRVARRPTGTSARRSTSTASSSAATRTCAASSPTTASSATRSARTSRSPATSRCATTPSRSAWSTSRSPSSRARSCRACVREDAYGESGQEVDGRDPQLHDELRAAAPGGARRAAPGARARRRGDPARRPAHRPAAPRHREARRDAHVSSRACRTWTASTTCR